MSLIAPNWRVATISSVMCSTLTGNRTCPSSCITPYRHEQHEQHDELTSEHRLVIL
jgi:hypothetical protein